jgi:hypothetical protein
VVFSWCRFVVFGAKGVSQILDVEVEQSRQACERAGLATLTLTDINYCTFDGERVERGQ